MFKRNSIAKEDRSKWVTLLGYLSAGVVVVTFFIYLTFPWDKLSLWIQGQVEKKTGVDVKVGKSEVTFPFNMVWKDVAFSWQGPGAAQVRAERLSVEWPFRAILGRRLELEFFARLLGGEFRGKLASQKSERGIAYVLKGSGDGFKLADLSSLTALPVKDLSGTVRIVSLEHAWLNEGWRFGEGKTMLELSKIEAPAYALSIDQIKGTIGMKGGMGNLQEISAVGEEFDLVGSGTLLLRPRFSESLLDFNSRLTVKVSNGPLAFLSVMASPGGSIGLSVRGPLGNPTPYINDQPFPALRIGFGEIRPERSGQGVFTGRLMVAGGSSK